jgi:hypothetical protein
MKTDHDSNARLKGDTRTNDSLVGECLTIREIQVEFEPDRTVSRKKNLVRKDARRVDPKS